MADLTPEQIQEIRRIVANHHYAFVANTVGPNAVPKEILEDLKARGLIKTTTPWPQQAYQYGQALAATHDPKLATMTPAEFKSWLVKNPVPLSTAEQRAVTYAQLNAAQNITNMGERVRTQVVSEVMQNISTRGTEGELRSALGHMADDWSRNWNRVAVTEKHTAMQAGYADELEEEYGEDAVVAIRHMGDACKHCKRLYGGQGEAPQMFKLSELRANGTNVGRKAADWLPVLPPAHPHCFLPGTLVRTFNGLTRIENLVPGVLVQTSKGWEPITHTWESRYDGETIRVQQADGAVFTVTPNHPFKLGGDWVPAGKLEPGDNLAGFQPDPARGIALGDTDAVDRPPLGSKKVGFARVLFGFSGSGVPISAIYLDGELYLREGEIYQEATDLVTGEGGRPQVHQFVVEPTLVGTAEFPSVTRDDGKDEFLRLDLPSDGVVEGGDVSSSVLWRKFGLTDQLGLGPAPLDVSRFLDASYDRAAGNAVPGSYFFHREQIVEVEFKEGGNVEFAPFRAPLGFGHAPPVPTAHRIVNADSVPYSGLVYNLTVGTSHEYVVGDTLTHNCQCQTTFVPRGWGFTADGEMVPASMLGKSLGKKEGGYFSQDGFQRQFPVVRFAVDNPSDALLKAYREHGTVDYQGFKIRIENPVGSKRHWGDENGEHGTTEMLAAYGYFEGTQGADGDELDCYIGPLPQTPFAYIVHQQNPRNGIYDEDKVMLGCSDGDHALELYRKHYDGPNFDMGVSEIELGQLRRWITDHTPQAAQQLVLKLEKADLPSTGSMEPGAVPTNPDDGSPSMYQHGAANIIFDSPQAAYPAPDPDMALVLLEAAAWKGERRVTDRDVMEDYLIINADMPVVRLDLLDLEQPEGSEDIDRRREDLDRQYKAVKGFPNKVLDS